MTACTQPRDRPRYGGLARANAEFLPSCSLWSSCWRVRRSCRGPAGSSARFLILAGALPGQAPGLAFIRRDRRDPGCGLHAVWLYRRVIFGKLDERMISRSIMDMNRREVAVFTPLLVLTILMGVYPGPFLEIIEVSVANLVDQHKTAMAAVEALSVSGR